MRGEATPASRPAPEMRAAACECAPHGAERPPSAAAAEAAGTGVGADSAGRCIANVRRPPGPGPGSRDGPPTQGRRPREGRRHADPKESDSEKRRGEGGGCDEPPTKLKLGAVGGGPVRRARTAAAEGAGERRTQRARGTGVGRRVRRAAQRPGRPLPGEGRPRARRRSAGSGGRRTADGAALRGQPSSGRQWSRVLSNCAALMSPGGRHQQNILCEFQLTHGIPAPGRELSCRALRGDWRSQGQR